MPKTNIKKIVEQYNFRRTGLTNGQQYVVLMFVFYFIYVLNEYSFLVSRVNKLICKYYLVTFL